MKWIIVTWMLTNNYLPAHTYIVENEGIEFNTLAECKYTKDIMREYDLSPEYALICVEKGQDDDVFGEAE